MAAELGRPVSTVHSWKGRGSIPDENKPDVLKAAQRLGLDITPGDFFPLPPQEAAE